MNKMMFPIFMVILIGIILAGCTTQEKAAALQDATKILVYKSTKGDEPMRAKIIIAANHALSLLEAKDQTLQVRHWDGLMKKIDIPELAMIKDDLIRALNEYVVKPAVKKTEDALKRLNRKTILFLIAFFKGIKEGATFEVKDGD